MEILQNGFCMIPNVVLYDNELSDKQKLLYWTISSLCAEKWYCRASNDYISELLWVNKWTISKNISELEKKWYINIALDSNYKRYIELNSIVENHNSCEKSQGGLWKITRGGCEKSQDINISDKYKINNNENSQEQTQEIDNSIPKQDNNITPTLTNGDLTFENIYKLFYHKSWHKPKINECKKVFDSLNLDKEWYEMLVKDLNLFRIEYKYWIKDQQYRPWFAKYVGWFNAEWVNEEYRLRTIIKFHMENREDREKMKKRYKDLCDTFWKDTIDKLVKEYGRVKNKITLNIN
jgi:hypothetical protein